MDDRQTVGKQGEEKACDYLRRMGQTIVERNWRSGHLEIDIITADLRGIHFVEVKTRTAPVMAAPEANVDRKKQQRLVKASQSYIRKARKPWMRDMEIFFDVLTVVLDKDNSIIEYYPQAFIPLYV